MATQLAHLRASRVTPLQRSAFADQLYLASKRMLDVIVASVALVALAPLMAIIALVIVLDSRGPALFKQQRVLGGQGAASPDGELRTFTFFKFRTMTDGADTAVHQDYVTKLIRGEVDGNDGGDLNKLQADKRVTHVGAVLRKTSLDELPQLVNVLRGEMSLVGPRPAIPYEVASYQPWHMHRLAVQQGLTGLWQTRGRSSLSFDEMVALDIEYAQTCSLACDLAIMAKTVPALLGSRNAC